LTKVEFLFRNSSSVRVYRESTLEGYNSLCDVVDTLAQFDSCTHMGALVQLWLA